MSLSPHIKYCFICLAVISIHIAILLLVFDYRNFTAGTLPNGDYIFKRSPEIYNNKPSITFISANKQGFKAEWTKVVLKNELHIDGYKVRLWELQNVTRYVQMKNVANNKMELLKETRYPETVTEWQEAYLEDRTVEWVIEGKDNTSFCMEHSLKPYTWYDLEILTLINGGEGAAERNNRFQVSN